MSSVSSSPLDTLKVWSESLIVISAVPGTAPIWDSKLAEANKTLLVTSTPATLIAMSDAVGIRAALQSLRRRR